MTLGIIGGTYPIPPTSSTGSSFRGSGSAAVVKGVAWAFKMSSAGVLDQVIIPNGFKDATTGGFDLAIYDSNFGALGPDHSTMLAFGSYTGSTPGSFALQDSAVTVGPLVFAANTKYFVVLLARTSGEHVDIASNYSPGSANEQYYDAGIEVNGTFSSPFDPPDAETIGLDAGQASWSAAYASGRAAGISSGALWYVGNLNFTPLFKLYGRLDTNLAAGFGKAEIIGHYAVYDHALSADDIARHWHVGHDGFSGDSDGARLNRILNYARWPASWRDIDDGDASLAGEQWDDGSKLLDELQAVEVDGGGVLFMSAAGKVTYRARLARVAATSEATFDCTGNRAPEAPLEWSVDDTHLCNIIKATRDVPGGVSTTVIDHDSVAEYEEIWDDSFTLRVTTDEEVVSRAREKIQRYKDPDTRISQLVLNPSASTGPDAQALWNLALGLEIGDKITLTNLPDHAPANEIDYFVESVADSNVIDGPKLLSTFTFDLSPAAIWSTWVDPETTDTVPESDDASAPDVLTTGSATVTSSTLVASITPTGTGLAPDHYRFELWDSGETTELDSVTVAASVHSHTFTGLSGTTAYKVHVYAVRSLVDSSDFLTIAATTT